MSNKRVHDYFKRKSADWSILGFLNESTEEPFKCKIEAYLKSLEKIMDSEQGKRRDTAKLLYDDYTKASKKKLFFSGNICGVAKIFSIVRHSKLLVEPLNQ